MFGNVSILYRRQTCRVCRLEMFDGNMYIATTSALTWYIVVELFFSLHLLSFGSSPKTIARFRVFQAGCS